MIYETTDLKKGWDGKYKNKILHDTYTWVVVFSNMDGVEFKKNGIVTIVR